MQIHARSGAGLQLVGAENAVDGEPLLEALKGALDLCTTVVPARAGAILLGKSTDDLQAVVAFGSSAKKLVNGHAPKTSPWLEQCLATTRACLIDDPTAEPYFLPGSRERTKSGVSAALTINRKSIGAIQLINPIAKTHFDHDDTKLMTALAKQTSRSLRHASSLIAHQALSLHDPLTGLRNTRNLEQDLIDAVRTARRSRKDVAVMFVDVDRLKRVNSKLGHAAGSEALRRTGRALAEAASETARTYRFGGDEFVVVQPGGTRDGAKALAEHLRAHVAGSTSGPMRFGGALPKITVSVGVATLRASLRGGRAQPKTIMARMLSASDRALFRAKSSGRNQVVMATRRDDRL